MMNKNSVVNHHRIYKIAIDIVSLNNLEQHIIRYKSRQVSGKVNSYSHAFIINLIKYENE